MRNGRNKVSDQETILQKSATGLKFTMVAQIATTVLSLVKTFVFTLFIEPEHFGLIAIPLVVSGVIQLLREFGYGTYIVQRKQFEEKELAFLNTRIICLGLCAFLLMGILTVPVSKFYNHDELLWVMPLTGLMFIFNSLTVLPVSLLRKELEFGKVAKIETLSSLIAIVVGLILLIFFKNYWVLLITMLTSYGAEIFLAYYFGDWKFALTNPLNKKLNALSTNFGAYITLFNIITFFSYNIDKLIIGKISGSAVLGVFSKSYDFGVGTISSVGRPLQNVYFSTLSKSHGKEKDVLVQFVYLFNTMLMLLVGPILICLNWLITTVMNESWASLSDMMPPFLLASFIHFSLSLTDTVLISKTNLRRYLSFGLIKAIVATSAIIISSFWGAKAIAWSYLTYHIVCFVPLMILILRGCDYDLAERRVILLTIAKITISSVLVSSIPWLLVYFNLLTIPAALAIFFLLFMTLHTAIWPKWDSYKTFKDFYRLILSRRAFSGV